MTQITNSSNIPITNGYTQVVPQKQVATPQVNVAAQPGITPIYQYPTTSLYAPNPNTKQAASGVNIIINNPSGLGYPSNYCCCPCNPTGITNPNPVQPGATSNEPNKGAGLSEPQNPTGQDPIGANPLNSSTGSENKVIIDVNGKEQKKKVVEITDQYVQAVESYLRSPDVEVRQMGISELIKRFEEDNSRYDHPALTALLNIALQDSSVHNRVLAMSPIATESAHGDQQTAELLQNILNNAKAKESDKSSKMSPMYVEESKMAQEALLKTVQTKTTV